MLYVLFLLRVLLFYIFVTDFIRLYILEKREIHPALVNDLNYNCIEFYE